MTSPTLLAEPARQTPIVEDCDLCIVGGSCTGVFAAVRAARLGLRVAIVELHNQFGGVATARMVNVWHSLWDIPGDQQIISGLTEEVMTSLKHRRAVIEQDRTNPGWQFCFNPAELACELDALVNAHNIRPFLHARMVAAPVQDGRIQAVVIEDKSGRRAIRARYFIDASGDADLARQAGLLSQETNDLQPPTMAAIFDGLKGFTERHGGKRISEFIFDAKRKGHLPPGFLWSAPLPSSPDLRLMFGTRVHGVDCADADQLTKAEMAGRQQLRQMVDLLREVDGADSPINLVAVPACIGVRETRHVRCHHRLTEQEVLEGLRFPDAIANGTYRVDIHHQGSGGLTFRYLDGREIIMHGDGKQTDNRWREERDVDPTHYQIPFRCLVPQQLGNLLVAGRHIDCDQGAFGAIRVVVNCNQMGEAAGVASVLACRDGRDVGAIDVAELRALLQVEGAALV